MEEVVKESKEPQESSDEKAFFEEKITVTEEGEKVTVEGVIGGRILRIETGELAKQANGSVLVRYGDTVVLVAATMSKEPRDVDFFPLIVDFEEKMYAAGKMPGGFFKREGKPSEKSILSARQIDRPLRPLFPEGMRNEVQVVCVVLSADMENDPDVVGMIGASAALTISGIPFEGPIGGVRIGLIDDEYVVNPTQQQLIDSKINIVVAGTKDNIMMVEASANEASEEEVLKAIDLGHQQVRKVIEIIEALAERAKKPPIEVPIATLDEKVEKFVRRNFYQEIHDAMRIVEKLEREKAFSKINLERALEILQEKEDEEDREYLLELLQGDGAIHFDKALKKIKEEELRVMVVDEKRRPDGRGLEEIRPISARVGILPRTHGSGLFTRGQTQVLTNLTLATLSEGQTIDDLSIFEMKRYMHQYNFPPYSVGEVKPIRGPGRREIGHGNLAERALLPVIPDEDEFPYSIRLVSEVLESNGSSSMASVCASTLALMDAGVPIRKPVAGIAMGLIMKDGDYTILTDIQGMEDFLGEMDFKVAGTRDGITALQMDIKVKGISIEIMRKALEQAKKARLEILDIMNKTISKPREELSPYAPRIFTMVIDPEKIRDVIGPAGKNINRIISETDCKIDIENDGTIYISSNNLDMAEKARTMIEGLVSDPEVGEIYQGTVVRITDFGAFVEIKPGKDGMIHISDMSTGRIKSVREVMNVGDKIMVQVDTIDPYGRINLKLPEVERQKKIMKSKSFQDRHKRGGMGRKSGKPHSHRRW